MRALPTPLRWFLVVPAAISAWFVIFLAGHITYEAIEQRICPAGEMVSGSCMNQRVLAILDIVIYVFAGISALAVESAAAVTAPSHKVAVTWVIFVAGCTIAALFGFLAHAYGPALTAVIAGLIGALVISRRAAQPEVSGPISRDHAPR